MLDELKGALARFEKEAESLFQSGNMQQAHGAMKEMAAATTTYIASVEAVPDAVELEASA